MLMGSKDRDQPADITQALLILALRVASERDAALAASAAAKAVDADNDDKDDSKKKKKDDKKVRNQLLSSQLLTATQEKKVGGMNTVVEHQCSRSSRTKRYFVQSSTPTRSLVLQDKKADADEDDKAKKKVNVWLCNNIPTLTFHAQDKKDKK